MIWLAGANGMLGRELARALECEGVPFRATGREVDIGDADAVGAFVKAGAFSWIVNCAAYTAVDRAEDEDAQCRAVNVDGAAALARAAREAGAAYIYISSDYVFRGDGKRPYTEDDETSARGVYALSKRDGERQTLLSCESAYIIRTAWLYGGTGNNFVQTMLRLMNEKKAITVVNDQRGTPTWARDLASVMCKIVMRKDAERIPFGIYHYTNAGECTWYDFACEIQAAASEKGILNGHCELRPCTSAEYPVKAPRPAYSVLDKSKIRAALSLSIPDWKSSLRAFVAELAALKGDVH